MASKVLNPPVSFAKLKVQKCAQEPLPQGYTIGADAATRVAHLEHSVRFLQDQHRMMLSDLHNEIEALRERNRDLQFQLIFNKESASKNSSPKEDKEGTSDAENKQREMEVENLKAEVVKLKHESGAARSQARAVEARAMQLQRLIDLQAEKLREFQMRRPACDGEHCESIDETRNELRARLADAERLVRRLRSDAEHQRRELQCMRNSLHAGLRANGIDYNYQQNYHFPAVHPEYYREEPAVNMAGRNVRQSRRVLTLPELTGQQMTRAPVYAHHSQPRAPHSQVPQARLPHSQVPQAKLPHSQVPQQRIPHSQVPQAQVPQARVPQAQIAPQPRVNGFDKNKRPTELVQPHPVPGNSGDESPEQNPNDSISRNVDLHITKSMLTYPELKVVIAKMIPHYNVSTNAEAVPPRPRPRRHHHRKHADHT